MPSQRKVARCVGVGAMRKHTPLGERARSWLAVAATRSTANEPGRLGDQSRRMGWIRSRITNDVIERLWSN